MAICECGCGQKTGKAKRTDHRFGYIKGISVRFVNGHNARKPITDFIICTHCNSSKSVSDFYKSRQYRNSWCKECCKALYNGWTKRNRVRVRVNARKRNDVCREQTFSRYGGKCVCCGESNYAFLTLDHINGGGGKQRQEIKRSGVTFYKWLRMKGYPEGFQVMCFNCNWAKHRYGICPHQQKKLEVA